MEVRNPFRIRKSEQLGSDSKFHGLFGPHMVEVLKKSEDTLWDRLHIIRSAPGGGKTSLLRLFTAESLVAIHNHNYSAIPEYKILYETVKSLGAITEEGPCVLGVIMPCTSPYSHIEHLKIEQRQKDRLFYSLLNARALFGVLRAVCTFGEINFPKGLNRVKIDPAIEIQPNFIQTFGSVNGAELFTTACLMEQKVCAAIDSIGDINILDLAGISGLLVWQALMKGSISIDGQPLKVKILFMLDDLHLLAPRQRKLLLSELESRLPVATWVAERYDALDRDALLTGSNSGREFVTHQIEEWALQNAKTFFQKGLGNIADRRVASAKTVELQYFEPVLEPIERIKNLNKMLQTHIIKVTNRLEQVTESEKRFLSWVKEVEEKQTNNIYENLVNWRTLEILIKRKQKRDSTLFPDFMELPIEEYIKMDSKAVKKAAELFIAQEFNIPYYHGLDILKSLSSGNVEQFLEIAGDIFEEVLASVTLRTNEISISPGRQQSIIQQVAKHRLEQIPQRMAHGAKVYQLIQNIGHFSQNRTYEPTAPYAPGVTGIAIKMDDLRKLTDPDYLKRNPEYEQIANVLREAISKNILEPRAHQLCKGHDWFVMYLNRLFCAHFWLPIDYGGWKEQSLNDLHQWITTTPPKKNAKRDLFNYE